MLTCINTGELWETKSLFRGFKYPIGDVRNEYIWVTTGSIILILSVLIPKNDYKFFYITFLFNEQIYYQELCSEDVYKYLAKINTAY